MEGAVGEADQPVHIKPDGCQHPAYFAVLALLERDREPLVAPARLVPRRGFLPLRVDRTIFDPVDRDAPGEPGQRCVFDAPVHAHPVAAHPARRRQFQLAGQLAVIGEQQQAFGRNVEPPDGDHPRHVLGQRIKDRRPSLRVARCRHQAHRLVITPQPGRFRRPHHLAIHHDLVGPGYLDGRGRQHAPVELDATGLDHRLRFPARADACTRQVLGNALALGGGVRAGGGRLICLRGVAHLRVSIRSLDAPPWAKAPSAP